MKVGIDPGHGGSDSGAVGARGYKEKDIVLSIAREIDRLLKNNSIKTVMTRKDDNYVNLNERIKIINDAKVDICISIHINTSANREAESIATFIYAVGQEAEKLATYIQQQLVKALNWKDDGVRVKNLHILREAEMPVALIECGFISNLQHEKELMKKSVQILIASAIVEGIMSYYKIDNNRLLESSNVKENYGEMEIYETRIEELERNLKEKDNKIELKNTTLKKIADLIEKALN